MKKKQSFFQRLTGSINLDSMDNNLPEEIEDKLTPAWSASEETDAQLTVDMHQTPTEIIVQSMVAGVKPEDLDVNITREMVTIKGSRERHNIVREEDYFSKELYWGSFTRTLLLPQEVEVERSEATLKNGLLTIRMPKLNKEKSQNVKVRLG